jgi:hypothetical protein
MAQATILHDRLLLERNALARSMRDFAIYLQGAAESIRKGEPVVNAEIKARSILRDAGDIVRLLGAADALQTAEEMLAPRGKGIEALLPEPRR